MDRRRSPLLRESDQPPPAPDAGLAAIAAGFAAQAGGNGHEEREPGTAPRIQPHEVWPLRLPPASIAAAGTIDPVDWGAPTGRAWHITYISVVFGAGATSATVYRESAQPVNQRFVFTATGIWEPRLLILLAQERLVVVSAGGGVTVALDGVQIDAGRLPEYLM